MTPLDNLRRLAAGWRGEWRVDAHEGITLSHDGEEWPIGALDGDAVIMLVALLNAIRPAVDGATDEIARLTAELADLRTQVHAEARSHATTRADLAVAVHELGEVTRAYHVANDAIGEVCRLVGAESSPGAADVAGNDASTKRDAVAKVRALVEASKPNSVEDAVAYFIDGHAKRLCEQDGEHWTGDGEQLDAWAAKVHDVLNHLRADADGTVIDGRESKPATVGGLLATAPVDLSAPPGGAWAHAIEWCDCGTWYRIAAGHVEGSSCAGWPTLILSAWSGDMWSYEDENPISLDACVYRLPARLVPAHLADADPSTRGPIGEVPDVR